MQLQQKVFFFFFLPPCIKGKHVRNNNKKMTPIMQNSPVRVWHNRLTGICKFGSV